MTTDESPLTVPRAEDSATANIMQAIIRTRFGPPKVLQVKEVEKPSPNDVRGVLIKVYASSVNPADRYEMRAPLLIRLIMRGGLRRPKDPRLGSDVAGRVEAVTSKVTKFKPGDEVFGAAPGSYAEYAVAREDRLAPKPSKSTFEDVAAVPIAALTALQALRDKGLIQSGKKVLINGAGGGVGTYAVQIAKSFDADVTAVTNTDSLELVRSLGADHLIDYTKEDFTQNGQRYDIICDIAASHSIGTFKRALNPGGICVAVGFKDKVILRLIAFAVSSRLLPKGGKKFRFFVAKINDKDLNIMKDLMEEGRVRSVIDKSYPLSETADAFRYFEQGHGPGKVVITMDQN